MQPRILTSSFDQFIVCFMSGTLTLFPKLGVIPNCC